MCSSGKWLETAIDSLSSSCNKLTKEMLFSLHRSTPSWHTKEHQMSKWPALVIRWARIFAAWYRIICQRNNTKSLVCEFKISDFRVPTHWFFSMLVFIVSGLDPARPLIEQHGSRDYRLTRDDANTVQIIHTNAGTLGQVAFTGSVDLCINGGMLQPFCRRGFRLSKSNIYRKTIIDLLTLILFLCCRPKSL